ncbi:MAG TPA: hypothetical protein VHI13_06880 [Candidatus Kapabacteria bacterium]|nr:hypothetical protein [Candidatus Kapabacteria bacterium]
MRPITAVIACSALCVSSFISCDRTTEGPVGPRPVIGAGSVQLSRPIVTDSTYVKDAGTLHNQGLAYLRAHYDFQKNYSGNSEQAKYLLSAISSYFQSARGWDSAYCNTVRMQDSLASTLAATYPPGNGGMWNAMKLQAPSAILSNDEIALIDNAMAVFSLPADGMSSTEIANRIIARADSSITILSSSAWSHGLTEAAGGFLYVMRGSAAYWQSHPVSTAENPNPSGFAQIVQADAAGYLIGWLMAVADEYDATGHIDPNNQGRRINRGLSMAIGWSFGGLLRG